MQTIKIAITGPFSAGKRAFIRGVNEIAFSSTKPHSNSTRRVKRKDVVRHFGPVSLSQELELQIFAPPPINEYDLMWERLRQDMFGFVVMLDATKSETFSEVLKIITTLQSDPNKLFVVVADKQNHPYLFHPKIYESCSDCSPMLKLSPQSQPTRQTQSKF